MNKANFRYTSSSLLDASIEVSLRILSLVRFNPSWRFSYCRNIISLLLCVWIKSHSMIPQETPFVLNLELISLSAVTELYLLLFRPL